MDWIQQTFSDGLFGKQAHYDVLKALRGVTAKDAKKQPKKNLRSIWDHVYHMVFWHDITLKAINGEEIDWDAIKGTDWLAPDATLNEKAWKELIASFANHLTELKRINETADLTRPIKGFGGAPLGKGVLIEIQHNSYHIGQVVILRQLLGIWPPHEDD
ncbi:MAG: DinB family protein [Promethearchaeota archaeon]